MGNHLVYSSLYRGSHFTTFCFSKASVVINILYFDNFIKMGPFGGDFGEKMIGNVLGALMRGAYCVEGSCFNLHFSVYSV